MQLVQLTIMVTWCEEEREREKGSRNWQGRGGGALIRKRQESQTGEKRENGENESMNGSR